MVTVIFRDKTWEVKPGSTVRPAASREHERREVAGAHATSRVFSSRTSSARPPSSR